MGDKTVSQIHTSTMTDRKAVIKNADMSEDMQTDAVECATQALEKYNIEKDIAAFIKKRIRQEIWPNLALHRRPKLRLLRHPRDEALYLLLPWPGRHLAFQVWISIGRVQTVSPICTTMPPYPTSCNAHVSSRFRILANEHHPWNI